MSNKLSTPEELSDFFQKMNLGTPEERDNYSFGNASLENFNNENINFAIENIVIKPSE